ncbi:TnsD family Tn7-like transposition protein [Paraburkholderia nemoris]|uniref:TnsD family Tn7-like transposition protein n=1 Tax=Paraburkholderia nemoris TaxID=2793076 RepID=UPI0038B77F23
MPDDVEEISRFPDVALNDEQRRACIKVAETSKYLLESGNIALHKNIHFLYRRLAFDCGFYRGALLESQRFGNEFRDFYGDAYLTWVGLDVLSPSIGRLIQNRMPPLCHVLVSIFLTSIASSSRGKKHPECINQFAEHGFGHPVDVVRRRQGRWTVQCRCGSVYRVDANMRINGISRYSPDYALEALRLRQAGLSAGDIAGLLAVPSDTVRRWITDGPPKNRPPIEALRIKQSEWIIALNQSDGFYDCVCKHQRLAIWLKRWSPEFYCESKGGFGQRGLKKV